MSVTLWQALVTSDAATTFEDALTSLRGFMRWTAGHVPADERDDADDAAHAAFRLADELALDDGLNSLDRRRLVSRMRSIPADRRIAVVLSATEDGPPPEVRNALAFMLRRIDRSDPKFAHPEGPAL